MGEKTFPAMHWQALEDDKVRCNLCPFQCIIADGKLGRCRVRQNVAGKLVSLNYYRVCATNVDPIEKKPLFHFQPGSSSFSVACIGCNFQCRFCQNWQISQMARTEGRIAGHEVSPKRIVDHAHRAGCKSIAYTYTEPTVFYELAYETGKLAHETGLKNVFVSNGYISIEALEAIEPYLDGINVDLKSFRDSFYRDVCHARLEPVLNSLRWLARSRVWVEVTTLVVPDQNDSDAELRDIAAFIASDLGSQVPWHVSRFHPDYEYTNGGPTPIATIERALTIGAQAGLRYCYGGNIPAHQSESTFCHQCHQRLIARAGFTIVERNIDNGRCPKCGTPVDGIDM